MRSTISWMFGSTGSDGDSKPSSACTVFASLRLELERFLFIELHLSRHRGAMSRNDLENNGGGVRPDKGHAQPAPLALTINSQIDLDRRAAKVERQIRAHQRRTLWSTRRRRAWAAASNVRAETHARSSTHP